MILARFPDLVHAAAELPDGLILDGELLVWAGEHLSFEALQRRAVSHGRTGARLAEQMPAHFVVFDVLQIDGHELLRTPYAECRARLETVFAEHHLADPWTLCPETRDMTLARERLMSWTEVPGIEGLIIRGSQQHYLPGARALIKTGVRSCGPSPAAHSCSPVTSGISPISSLRPREVTRGRASGSLRHGGPEPRWTWSLSSRNGSPRLFGGRRGLVADRR
ncbi:hypothetical protein BFF78_04320 [Streptomyces fodineus]|uniref:ATP-dependent DNA ligase family profile domain-containing protein n=1 Tax=Streptomyces fodineus TaxID=1904616 RepID=A0A1D7Y465_9ACTN|nr:hypothetical protein [Streptomyces fodineus]AOR30382.1 hypothetical protein BFF78_04320 [Streptomyces fodineus]